MKLSSINRVVRTCLGLALVENAVATVRLRKARFHPAALICAAYSYRKADWGSTLTARRAGI